MTSGHLWVLDIRHQISWLLLCLVRQVMELFDVMSKWEGWGTASSSRKRRRVAPSTTTSHFAHQSNQHESKLSLWIDQLHSQLFKLCKCDCWLSEIKWGSDGSVDQIRQFFYFILALFLSHPPSLVILNYVLCWICLNGVGFDLLVIQRMEVHIINWWGLCHLGMSYLTPLTGSSTPLAISRSALPVYLFWYKLFNLHTILQDCELEYWARQSPLLCWQGLLVSSNQADLRSLTRLDSRNRLVKLVCV